MLELLNIRFRFSLRTSHQNSQGKSATVLRITFQAQRSDIFTGLYCFQKDWDRGGGRVMNSDEQAKSLNENLAMILQGAKNSFDEMKFSRQPLLFGSHSS
jgi:Arm domain-containing DNA-binding protein